MTFFFDGLKKRFAQTVRGNKKENVTQCIEDTSSHHFIVDIYKGKNKYHNIGNRT